MPEFSVYLLTNRFPLLHASLGVKNEMPRSRKRPFAEGLSETHRGPATAFAQADFCFLSDLQRTSLRKYVTLY